MPKKFGEVQKAAGGREEKDKRFLMWTGTAFFMVIISVLVILNLRSVLADAKDEKIIENSELSELSTDLQDSLKDLAGRLEELKAETEAIASSVVADEISFPIDEPQTANIVTATGTADLPAAETDNLTKEAGEASTGTPLIKE